MISDKLACEIVDLFYQLINKLYELGEIKFENLLADGTKIEANANRHTFVWAKAVEKNAEKLRFKGGTQMRKIIKLRQPKVKPKKIRVAAYARVSRKTARTNHSLAAQVSYYSEHIQSNPDCEYAGVYIDSFITGTKTANRDGFNELISDCDAGKIDLVLVKSISRFARNTVDLLNTVRHLMDIGVAVYFEKERINTLSSEGEFLLTVLASFAQEEITSMSNNIKWAIKRKFQQGIPAQEIKTFGYDWLNGEMVINRDEAEIVRKIFNDYLAGSSAAEIQRAIYDEHPNLNLTYQRITRMISDECYIGKLTLQKYYSSSPISKKTKVNKGELPFYIVDSHHEPIIDKSAFDAVQVERKKRFELGAFANKSINTSCLTGKIKCGHCGRNYTRQHNYNNLIKYSTWVCDTIVHGKRADCSGKRLRDDILKKKFTEVSGQEYSDELFEKLIDKVVVAGAYVLDFYFKDGHCQSVKWELTGNRERWTAEERKKRSDYTKMNPIRRPGSSCLTSKIQCGRCGENFRRHHIKTNDSYSWGCSTGKRECGIRWAREDEIKRVAAAALELTEFDEQIFSEKVERIVMLSNEELTIHFADGSERTMPWNSKRIIKEGNRNAKNSKSNSGND